ncbi:HAMP domain-containing methyl-accepting chemotaxis protein [Azospirillum oleiclasticum]|nr:methyl-accepting chemotaxis protein [Azospirillum oleiclasticum]
MKISRKIAGGFIAVLVLLAVMAGVVLVGQSRTSETVERFDNLMTNALRVSSIENDMTDIRRLVRIVLNSGDAESVARIKQLDGKIKTDLAKAAEVAYDPERRANLQRITALVAEYMLSVDRVVEALNTRNTLYNGKQMPLGTRARQALSGLMSTLMDSGELATAARVGVAQEKLLLARLSGARFLDTAAPADAEAMRSELAAFTEAMKELRNSILSQRHTRVFDEVEATMAEYGRAFEEVVKAVITADDLVNKVMLAKARELSSLIESTLESQDEAAENYRDVLFGVLEQVTNTTIILAVAAMLFGALVAFVITRGIVGPVTAMTGAMGRLAGGDLSADIPALGQRDEIGRMAEAVAVFKDAAIENCRLVAEQERLKEEAEREKRRVMNELANNFEAGMKTVVQTVSATAAQLQSNAQSMSAIAEETSRQSTAVAASTEQASANVQTVASASEELAASISEISRQVSDAATISKSAMSEAEQTNARIEALASAAQRIGDVVGLIQSIASQTNLLALNATIEAARAGEAGKGFAVVASEVKQLANQTGRATEDIAVQVAEIQQQTNGAVDAIRGIGRTIGRLSEISNNIASAVEEQAAATKEIGRNVQQAAQGTQEVSNSIVGVSKAAEEAGTASSQVLTAADQMAGEAGRLKHEVETFVARVRAA